MLSEAKYSNKNGGTINSLTSASSSNQSSTPSSVKSNGTGSVVNGSSLKHHHHQYNTPYQSNGNGNHISAGFTKGFNGALHHQQINNNNNHCGHLNSDTNGSICDKSPLHFNQHSSNSNGGVKFADMFKDKIDEREKYLTAKYPNHQMTLIKKRLKVEFWIDEQLKTLFNITDDNVKEDYDICPDDLVDTLLDMDTDNDRRYHIISLLTQAKKPKDAVMTFVDELLIKLRML